SWQLAAMPIEGWINSSSIIHWIWISGIIIGLLLAALTIVIYRYNIRIQHNALHDQLTKLPNRLLFNERVSQALANAQRNHGKVAMAVMDLNKFKPVNDTYGHLAGDYVLEQVAYRIRTTLRKEDVVARTGGDEFTMLFVSIKSEADIAMIVNKLISRLLEPFIWQGQQLCVGLSIGIAIYPEHGDDMTKLFHQADIAMYEAKHDPSINWKIMPMQVTLPLPSIESLETS
ncbi:MAG: GGDEF domain-containing protein, partial [Sedimenticola sp.]|nr:GGDEF domain-containing protein [Sedimenticola sp.]